MSIPRHHPGLCASPDNCTTAQVRTTRLFSERCHTGPILYVIVLCALNAFVVRSIESNSKLVPHTHNMAAETFALGYAANVASGATGAFAALLWTHKPKLSKLAARLDQMQLSTQTGMARIREVKQLIPQEELDKIVISYHRWVCNMSPRSLFEFLSSLCKMHGTLSAMSLKERIKSHAVIKHWSDNALAFEDKSKVSSRIKT
jgi:hypothetical protein